jgi:hypothetical protein
MSNAPLRSTNLIENCDLWDDEAKGAYRNDRKRACHDTLPRLISVLLDEAGVACSELH